MAKRKREQQEQQQQPQAGLLPQKKFYRQRAHANPFSDHSLDYPASPRAIDWAPHYPAHAGSAKVPEFADVGCGFGGLLIALAPQFPDTLMLGLEIRVQVSQYVQDRITALRVTNAAQSSDSAPAFQNVSIVRANAMKFLPNYFTKHSLSALFFLFPDPHFKSRKHKARIISPTLLAEYAYVLRPGGIVYTITDVRDLHEWMKEHLTNFPLFQPVDEDTLRSEGKGPIIDAVYHSTEEGKKNLLASVVVSIIVRFEALALVALPIYIIDPSCLPVLPFFPSNHHHHYTMAAPAAALAVPPSILDTDLYKLSMQQAVFKTFPDVQATYRFTNRNKSTLFSRQCAERFRTAVSHFSFLALTQEEREWLQNACPFLEPSYLEYLSGFRYKPEQVDIEFVPAGDDGGQIYITITGPWVEAIMWEVPLMACLSETYFQTVDKDWDYEGQADLAFEKGKTLVSHGCAFSEFGTRRRRSYRTQEIVVENLVKANEAAKGPGRLTGTSNVHLAHLYGLEPIGTIAHEWFMGIAALKGYENANAKALKIWEEVYETSGTALIALTDTFTTDAFFRQEFAEDTPRAQRWTGLRQDSGDPFLFGPRVKALYESLGIDPATKLLVYSDSLSTEKAVKIREQCTSLGLTKASFGIGTHFTNDFKSLSSSRQEKSKALNIVIKLAQVDNKPCIKLSDDLTKTTGDKATVDYVIDLYHLPKS
ncbi:hypothetical protein MD484_g5922, partial [Candolleomyces efflorescens]